MLFEIGNAADDLAHTAPEIVFGGYRYWTVTNSFMSIVDVTHFVECPNGQIFELLMLSDSPLTLSRFTTLVLTDFPSPEDIGGKGIEGTPEFIDRLSDLIEHFGLDPNKLSDRTYLTIMYKLAT